MGFIQKKISNLICFVMNINFIKESKILKGLYPYKEVNTGWYIQLDTASDLLKVAKNVRDSEKVKDFDCFTPFPIHGLEEAMGLSRSWLPFITLKFGIIGALTAITFMTYVDIISWPTIVGGKPFWSWPAYIPITFELMVLFAGLSTVGAVIVLGKLGKISRKPIIPEQTSSKFVVWIPEALDKKEVEAFSLEVNSKIDTIKEKNL